MQAVIVNRLKYYDNYDGGGKHTIVRVYLN